MKRALLILVLLLSSFTLQARHAESQIQLYIAEVADGERYALGALQVDQTEEWSAWERRETQGSAQLAPDLEWNMVMAGKTPYITDLRLSARFVSDQIVQLLIDAKMFERVVGSCRNEEGCTGLPLFESKNYTLSFHTAYPFLQEISLGDRLFLLSSQPVSRQFAAP